MNDAAGRGVLGKRGAAKRGRSGAAARNAQRADRQSKDLLVFGEAQRRDFEASPRPMRIFDLETLRFLAVNDAAVALYGYTREEFLALTLKDTRHPAEHDDLRASLDRPRGYLLHFGPRRHLKKSGEIFVTEIVTQDVCFDGRAARLSLTIDVTERNWSEQVLRESEERFRQLAENIEEVFWIKDPATNAAVYVSPTYAKIWGRPCETAYSNPASWMDPIHPDDLPAVRETQARMPLGENTDVEYRILRADGTLRWIRDRSYPMRRGDGTPLTCGIAEDITSRKRSEQERIDHAIEQRDALVREVHHRIKNHLQGIAGLLRNKAGDNPAAAATIEAAVAQLQSVAVVYGLQSELAESGVPLCRVLEAICSSAEGLSAARIERTFGAASGTTRLATTEAAPVAVALNELVSNAIEHGVRHGGAPVVEVSLRELNDRADIRIVNGGTLPERFDYARGTGTGTGLALVKTLLGPAGGSLRFGARDGRVETILSLRPPLMAPRDAAREPAPDAVPRRPIGSEAK